MNELNPILRPVTSSIAHKDQQIIGKNYRITVLTSELIRVEISFRNEFEDRPTQSVWFRDFAKPSYDNTTNRNILTITTDKVIYYFDTNKCKVTHLTFKDSNITLPCSNKGNLKGTARTLDRTFGPTPLKDGIMSKNGVYIYDDSASLLINENGNIVPRHFQEEDLYIFAYGTNYIKCLSDFYQLTGKTPLIPRFALGNWWSRYRAYSEEEYITLMKRFIEEDLPITVATVDMDWHWVDVNKRFNTKYKGQYFNFLPEGWTGYSWNTELFPDYKRFLNWLQEHNLKVPLNLHPADGVRPYEDMYEKMAKAMGINPESKEPIPFDLSDNNFINNYFKILHHPYEKDGVDFWWIDWQQGKKSDIKGLDPLWALNHYHFLDSGREKRPLILSRYAGVGSHRYPLGFSGDAAINWSVLKFQPYFTANATNVGYTWWSHDIGGHCFGKKNDELHLRWVQFGVFSPIMRLHSTSNDLLGKEPWFFSKDIQEFINYQLRLRHRMIPYIYSMNYRNYNNHRALIEPMYYNYPNIQDAYQCRNQYFFGSELIVSPIVSHINKKLKMAKVKVWLPEGKWTDIFTNQVYSGGKWITMCRGLDSIPVLAKQGAMIPLSNNKGNNYSNPNNMTLWIYKGNSSFELYEDNGEDNKHTQGEFSITKYDISENGDKVEFVINKVSGDTSIIPKERCYELSFKDIIGYKEIDIKVNNKSIKAKSDCKKNLRIILDNICPSDKVFVTITGVVPLSNMAIKDKAIEVLSKYQGSNTIKSFKYRKIKNCTSNEEYIKKVKRLRFAKIAKEAILETLG